MKKYILLVIGFFILIACKHNNDTQRNSKLVQDSIKNTPASANIDNTTEEVNAPDNEFNSGKDEDDCIFDQKTQTDDFLKNIEELKTYSWNSKDKKATIALENNDTLFIKRGGCYSFGVSAKFYFYNDTTDYSDWGLVFEKVLWIAKLLEKEFYLKEVKADLENDAYSIQELDNSIQSIWFENQLLIDNNYEITRSMESDITTIEFSYYLN